MTAASRASSLGVIKPDHAHFSDALYLESGEVLDEFELVYETYGALQPDGNNAILICHALSGNHHAAGFHSEADTKPGWWDTVIGPGKPIDTNRFFVVCPNNIGGCNGSTGPASISKTTGKPWGSLFPQVTVGDWVESQKRLAQHLGINQWAAVVGGSLGGMQALQWSVTYPDWVTHCVVIAAAPGLTAQNIAFNEIARQAIFSDPDWCGGDYIDANTAPEKGMALARMVGHLTYMSADNMSDRFGRELRQGSFDPDDDEQPIFQVESYLRYQGSQFATRFDANTYVLMTRALDRFDLAASSDGDLAKALEHASAEFLILSFSSDWRFSPARSREITTALLAAGKRVTYSNLESDAGHDAFLLEEADYIALLHAWMQRVAA
ncbi:homoserine O-acetyltransferase [Luminiphilus sp.]|nr:homoserine O-acetyltransferase [Luminiphilus sp.]MDA9877800.1 homoserine O-acetyltransferase [Luminiphilus sp.]MDB2379257.1 homoserine O-acetyltransferase [Luminiphilus sp.]MDB2659998.1 homoserine O-acetyltransferase [Luminiphilus sp.]MDC0972896.1 homoserine O-acetyltransferase [Luminiphilus sp.]